MQPIQAPDPGPLARAAQALVDEVSLDEALALREHEAALWIDVREPGDGHPPAAAPAGALRLPLSSLPAAAQVLCPDRQRPLIALCSNGERAALAAIRLELAGFRRVYSLRGGLGAWSARA